jgi:hypothetical protein
MKSKAVRGVAMTAATFLTASTLVAGVATTASADGGRSEPTHVKKHWVKQRLVVKKTALTSHARIYTWDIDKKAERHFVVLKKGESKKVGYEVKLAADYKDFYKVAGKIYIKNPSWKRSAKITGVKDVVSPNIGATVSCGVRFPYRLGPGKRLTCSYWTPLPDGKDRWNKATVTTARHSKVQGNRAFAKVHFGDTPDKVVDKCVKVADSKKGFLGLVCAEDESKEFSYELTVGPYDNAGRFWFKNVAAFKTEDTGKVGFDKEVVKVLVLDKGTTAD